ANAKWPKATSGYTRTFLLSDRYIEDGSYLKLKNLSLSYRLFTPFKGVEQILFTLSASNLFTISKYSGYDPDVNAFGSDSSRRGVDIYSYPASRTFSLGVNFVF
ncbi:MAG: SusC/RagA family protein, partial [Bacteroidales bacterium]|nr:SusC/RagA family protein [Bacteroidales bacterium]